MNNHTILITGGTTGIGLATAKLLLDDGFQVIVTGRNPSTIATAKEALDNRALILRSDSNSLEDARALGQTVGSHVKRLDGVFFNAGIAQLGPFESMTPRHFSEQFGINVQGPFFQLQSLLPLLQNPSSVVFNASVVAEIAFANASLYSATKAAVVSLGKTLAVELAQRGIRVNTLSPGPIRTPIFGKMGLDPSAVADFEADVGKKSLAGRMGDPSEIAKVARFLLSADSSYIMGENVVVDGGVRLV